MGKTYKRASLYTQGKNECTLYSLLNIMRTQWGIIVKPTLTMKLIASAESAGVFSARSGAIFSIIYKRFTRWVYKNYGLRIYVEAVDINSQAFKDGVSKGNTYGLGLMFASSWYKEVRADKKITRKEVDKFDVTKNKRYGHNHTYKLGYIIESLSSVDIGKRLIKMDVDILRAAVRKGIYWSTARTLKLGREDSLLDYYLRELNKGRSFNVDRMTELEKKACLRAIELRDSYLFAI